MGRDEPPTYNHREDEVVMTVLDTSAPPGGGESTRRSTNLTRTHAAERAKVIVVDSYQIVVDVTDGHGNPGANSFRSTSTVTFTAQPGAQSLVDLVPGDAGALHSATLNNPAIDVSGYDGNQGLTLAGLAANNTLVVEAECTYSQDGEGLYRFTDPADSEVYRYTQFETAAAKRVFACFDQPDLKARFELGVIAPNPGWSCPLDPGRTSRRGACAEGPRFRRHTLTMATANDAQHQGDESP